MPERFYVPLPDLLGRQALLMHERDRYRKGVGEPLSEEAVLRLAQQLEGYSGSDIAALFRKAYKRSVVALTEATHFKQHGECILVAEDDDAGARELSYDKIQQKKRLRPVALDEAQLMEAMQVVRASQCDNLGDYEEWTRKKGARA